MGNISSAVRFASVSSADQHAKVDRIASFDVLVSWLVDQAENHYVDVSEVRELLFQLIHAEHCLYR